MLIEVLARIEFNAVPDLKIFFGCSQLNEMNPVFLDAKEYDEMRRREAAVTALFLDEAEQMVEKELMDSVSPFL